MATNTAASFTNHTGNGSAGPFSISFSYLSEAEVDVTVGGVLKTITTHYTFTSATQITFTSGNHPGNGVAVKFQRDTDISSKKVDFQDGSVLTEVDLDNNSDQVIFAQQEIIDKLNNIEENATADQTNAEIRTAVEAATDSNVFTDADHTKLNAIEAGATTDQTASEIRTLVESASDSNVFTDADHSKLNAIEASADVTDATNVDAAGAVMNSDLDTKGELLVGDGSGDPSALSVGTNGYILTADSSEATGIKWAANAGGGGGSAIGNVVEDTSPQLGGNLDVQAREITTSTTNGNIVLNPNGEFGVVRIQGDSSTSVDGTLELRCSTNAHGVKIKSPAHSAGASYTLTLPINIVNGQFLKTDTNGNLSWAAVDLTALSAANLTSGTIPDARFPATLPAASAANLTAIPAANITGTLPAIDGSALTGVASTTGGGAIYENSATISASRVIPSGSNGMSAGPIAVANGITLTVSSGSVYTVV